MNIQNDSWCRWRCDYRNLRRARSCYRQRPATPIAAKIAPEKRNWPGPRTRCTTRQLRRQVRNKRGQGFPLPEQPGLLHALLRGRSLSLVESGRAYATWIGVDKLFVEVNELLNRDETKAEIISLLRDFEAEVATEMIATQRALIRSQAEIIFPVRLAKSLSQQGMVSESPLFLYAPQIGV